MYSVWQSLSWLFFLILALFKKQFKKAIELNEGGQKEPSLLILLIFLEKLIFTSVDYS